MQNSKTEVQKSNAMWALDICFLIFSLINNTQGCFSELCSLFSYFLNLFCLNRPRRPSVCPPCPCWRESTKGHIGSKQLFSRAVSSLVIHSSFSSSSRSFSVVSGSAASSMHIAVTLAPMFWASFVACLCCSAHFSVIWLQHVGTKNLPFDVRQLGKKLNMIRIQFDISFSLCL